MCIFSVFAVPVLWLPVAGSWFRTKSIKSFVVTILQVRGLINIFQEFNHVFTCFIAQCGTQEMDSQLQDQTCLAFSSYKMYKKPFIWSLPWCFYAVYNTYDLKSPSLPKTSTKFYSICINSCLFKLILYWYLFLYSWFMQTEKNRKWMKSKE